MSRTKPITIKVAPQTTVTLTVEEADALRQQIMAQLSKQRTKTDQAYLAAARDQCVDGGIAVDTDAVISKGADNGAYVMAWLWVEDTQMHWHRRHPAK